MYLFSTYSFQIAHALKLYQLDWLLSELVQDVVETMKESLYDKYVDENGLVDFGRSGGMSQQKEAKRFLSALNKQSELLQKDCFSISVCDLKPLRNFGCYTFNLKDCGGLKKASPDLLIICPGNIQFGG